MSEANNVSISRLTWGRCVHSVRVLLTSEVRWKAIFLLSGLLVLLLGVSGINVVGSYVNRAFMTAIERRDGEGFFWQSCLYVGVFGCATAVAVFYRFCEERLGLLWRELVTRRLVGVYLKDRNYLHLKDVAGIDNPDQRMTEDARAYTTTLLSFFLMFMNGAITILAFSGVMWSISPALFGITIVYAAIGSCVAVFLGRPLVRLNYAQFDREASLRADLIHVREEADSIAIAGREGQLRQRIQRRVDDVVTNWRKITGVNRNLGFSTTGYGNLTQIIPALVVAPLFIHGKVEFGVIAQSATAFLQLIGAFSLIVTQFQSISSFTAVVARLGVLGEGLDKVTARPASKLTVEEDAGHVAFQNVTLSSREDKRTLVRDLSFRVDAGKRVLIQSEEDRTRVALFRAAAGLWDEGEGKVVRPAGEAMLFLAERPYLPPGTLREVLSRSVGSEEFGDDELMAVLRELGLEETVKRVGGLDADRDWDDMLSLSEQQLVACAALAVNKPRFAFLDRIGKVLGPEEIGAVSRLLNGRSIGYLVIGEQKEEKLPYDSVLQFAADGSWKASEPDWKGMAKGSEPSLSQT